MIRAQHGSDTRLELVALAEDVLDVGDAVVADLADVQQAVEAADVDEGAVRLHRLHGAHHHVANLWRTAGDSVSIR